MTRLVERFRTTVRDMRERYGIFRKVSFVVSTPDLAVVGFISAEEGGAREGVDLRLLFPTGVRADERSYGVHALACARRRGDFCAVWGWEHTCPALHPFWSLAAPVFVDGLRGDRILGYVGLFADRREELEGYVGWLAESLHAIRRDVEEGLERSSALRWVRPTVAVYIPAAVARLLTPREHEVLAAFLAGLSLDAVAREFYLTRSSVRTYLERVAAKLGVEPRLSELRAYIDRMAQSCEVPCPPRRTT
ncbi:helix-turn-helix transcriptional regulator [Brockia lithotrophica]|uniref:helix-turn-helix transcriptional regulator n=1 Tax=Brockia lithotrophica TaxID=933949 RepID=UPI0011C37814|nr:helix-turn-helix transcriptional regulator [Brockia lithotrophica]